MAETTLPKGWVEVTETDEGERSIRGVYLQARNIRAVAQTVIGSRLTLEGEPVPLPVAEFPAEVLRRIAEAEGGAAEAVPDPDDHGPAEAPAPTAWTDEQVQAAARALWGMGWDACSHPNVRKEGCADVRRALDAALAAGPMPVRVEAAEDGEAAVRELADVLYHAYETATVETVAAGYRAEARAALAWMRGHPDPGTVALVRAARMALDILRADTATRRCITSALVPFAGVGEGEE